MPKSRLIRIAVLSVVALVIAAGIAWWQVERERDVRTVTAGPQSFAAAPVGGPFELVDHTGATVTDEAYRGRFMLVYFGFTFCPDVCPTALSQMAAALDLLGEDAAQVQPIFITVDPERDTVEAMAGYVGLFHPRMAGLTGTPEQVDQAASAYRVYYAKAEDPTYSYYLMDHTSFVYLMGPDGENLAVFPHGTAAGQIAEAVRTHLPQS